MKLRDTYGLTGIGAAIVAASIVVALVIVIFGAMAWGCSSYADISGRETRYSAVAGCFVKTGDGVWFSINQYEQIRIEGLTP